LIFYLPTETLQELDCEYEIFDMIDDYNTTLIHDAEQAVLKKILEEFIPEFNQRQQDQKKTVPTRRKRIKKNN
jgi:predicted secreted protein